MALNEDLEYKQLDLVEHLVTAKMLPDCLTKKVAIDAVAKFLETNLLDLRMVNKKATKILERKALHRRPEGDYPQEVWATTARPQPSSSSESMRRRRGGGSPSLGLAWRGVCSGSQVGARLEIPVH